MTVSRADRPAAGAPLLCPGGGQLRRRGRPADRGPGPAAGAPAVDPAAAAPRARPGHRHGQGAARRWQPAFPRRRSWGWISRRPCCGWRPPARAAGPRAPRPRLRGRGPAALPRPERGPGVLQPGHPLEPGPGRGPGRSAPRAAPSRPVHVHHARARNPTGSCARAWQAVDEAPHVIPFPEMRALGDGLVRAGLAEPVLDTDTLTLKYREFRQLIADLRATGTTNASAGRRPGLTGRQAWSRLTAAYEQERGADGLLPATVEVVFGQAWAPGTPPPAALPGRRDRGAARPPRPPAALRIRPGRAVARREWFSDGAINRCFRTLNAMPRQARANCAGTGCSSKISRPAKVFSRAFVRAPAEFLPDAPRCCLVLRLAGGGPAVRGDWLHGAGLLAGAALRRTGGRRAARGGPLGPAPGRGPGVHPGGRRVGGG